MFLIIMKLHSDVNYSTIFSVIITVVIDLLKNPTFPNSKS